MEIVLGTYAYALIMFFISTVFFFVIEKSNAQAILTLILLIFIITFLQSCSKENFECNLEETINRVCDENDKEACIKDVTNVLSYSCNINKTD